MSSSNKDINTESSLNDGDDLNSKNMLFDLKYKSSFGKIPLEDKKSKKTKNYNIYSSNNQNVLKNTLGPSLYHITNKNKKKKDIYKSTNNIFENRDKKEIQVGLKSIKN